ncbi:MAG: sulfite exporter TauE/SafE family protein [Bacteroidota bacterium]
MEIFYTFILLFLGFFIGLIGTFIGVGGGILLIMVLLFMVEPLPFDGFESVRIVIVNSAFILYAMQLSLFIRKVFRKEVYLKATTIVAIPAILITTLLGFIILQFDIIDLFTYKIIFVVFIIYTSFILISNRERGMFEVCNRGGVKGNLRNLFAGILSGTFTSITGADSGIFIVPVLNKYCDIDIRKAVNIYNSSLFFILLTIVILFAVIPNKGDILGNDFTGYIYWPYALPLLGGAFTASFIGYTLFQKFKFNYFVYPLVFIFTVTALRILFSDILYSLYL